MLSKNRRIDVRWMCSCLAVLIAGFVLVACGAQGDSSSGDSGVTDVEKASAVTTTIPKSGCGAVATPAPEDPDGVLASLPETYKQGYAGFQLPVNKSPWSDFKPDHGPPYKVGLAYANVQPGFQTDMYNGLKKALDGDPNIELSAIATGDALNIPQQIQNYNSLLNKEPDIMIVEPLTDAFGPAVDKAAKQGVPTVSFQGNTSSENAVNVSINAYNTGATLASTVFRQMGGKGNLLFTHAIASIDIDKDRTDVTKAALKNCPGIKLVGEIAGGFDSSTAKAETIKFLATHPEKIDGVLQVGQMATGIISGFEQSGRPMPAMDTGADKGALGYWDKHQDSFVGVGSGFNTPEYANSIASIVKRMLAGHGVKVDQITQGMPTFTADTLDQWAEPGWNLRTPGNASGPGGNFLTEDYIAGLFNDPKPG